MRDDDSANETERLLGFLYACPIGLIQTDLQGEVSLVNPMAMQLMLPMAGGKPCINLFHIFETYAPELRTMVRLFEAARGTICSGHKIHVGHPQKSRSAASFVLACTIVKLDLEQLMISLENVSDRVAQERRMREAEVWFASLLDSPEGFAVIGLDAAGRIEVVNASARQQTGFSEADLLGQPASVLDIPDAGSGALDFEEEIEFARRDGWHLAEGWCALQDGGRYRCQRLISVCREIESNGRQEVTGYTVVLRPVTKGGVDARELRRRLTTDHLTGVYNRAHFFELADRERERCQRRKSPLGLLVVDLDHFKQVNDTYGHAVGDQVLERVAQACRAELRPADSFARLGGEEFVALLPGAGPDLVADIGERLRAATEAVPIMAGGIEITVTASLGGVSDKTNQLTIRDLLEAADCALYQAKRGGRNRVVLDREQRAVA